QSAGYLYPAYASYKALKTRNARELVHWLEYWAVLGTFTLVEFFADIFLFCGLSNPFGTKSAIRRKIPLTDARATAFVATNKVSFLLLPKDPWRRKCHPFPLLTEFSPQGSRYIYRSLLHPTLERHEREIDEALQQAQVSAITTSSSLGRQAMQAIQKAAVESFSQASFGGADNAKATSLQTSVAVRSTAPQTSGGGTSRVAALISAAANMLTVTSSSTNVSEVGIARPSRV
ncbi:MAG: LOW QUALITY PROTEIN: hypothetical protein BJ554DRAFT_7972, partial [Olpidium bornovanus]